jgi:hypothetical protein
LQVFAMAFPIACTLLRIPCECIVIHAGCTESGLLCTTGICLELCNVFVDAVVSTHYFQKLHPILWAYSRMAQFVKEHSPQDFSSILTELTEHPIPVNKDRLVAGEGRSQAFGVIRRWSYRPWLSRNTWMRPVLWQYLLDFAAAHVHVPWDAIQVNDNYASKPHRDKGNRGLSYIVGFGDYTDGALMCDVSGTYRAYDIRHRGYLFHGAETLHYTAPWEGHRYSLVFFSIEWPSKFPPYTISSRLTAEGTEITDTYDDSIIILDRRGRLVRTVQEGRQMPWRGRLTERGQRSRM